MAGGASTPAADRPAVVVHGGAGRRGGRARERIAALRGAVEAAWHCLQNAGTALDAAVAAVVVLEDSPWFNAGTGAVVTSAGTVELDASAMRGADLAAGAVALVRRSKNPVLLARALVDLPPVLIAGPATARLARRAGVPLVRNAELVAASRTGAATAAGTVGAVVVDLHGHVAAATSTGGTAGKPPGRIGDSAVIGAGTYADDEAGAASATGLGETMIRATLTRAVVDRLRSGSHPMVAVRAVLREVARRLPPEAGVITADALGRVGWACLAESMLVAWRRGGGAVSTADAATAPGSTGSM